MRKFAESSSSLPLTPPLPRLFDSLRVDAASPALIFDSLVSQIRDAVSSRKKGDVSNGARMVGVPVCYEAEFALNLDEVAQHHQIDAAGNCRSSPAGRVSSELRWIRAWVPVPERVAGSAGHAAPRHTAQRNPGRLGRHRRKTNGHLSCKIARRLEHHWPHSACALRSFSESAGPFCAQATAFAFTPSRATSSKKIDNVKATILRAGFLTTGQDLGRTGFPRNLA